MSHIFRTIQTVFFKKVRHRFKHHKVPSTVYWSSILDAIRATKCQSLVILFPNVFYQILPHFRNLLNNCTQSTQLESILISSQVGKTFRSYFIRSSSKIVIYFLKVLIWLLRQILISSNKALSLFDSFFQCWM